MKETKLFLPLLAIFLVAILLGSKNNLQAQCPADITTGGPHTITSAISPCSDSGDSMNGTEDITIENGATLTLTVTTRYRVNGATILVENGGTLIVNGSGGLLVIVNGGSLIVEGGTPGGSLQTTGNLNIGNPAGSNSGSIQLDGNAQVGGSLNLNGMGTISGSGTITVTEDINDNGGDDTGWTGNESCSGTCDDLPVELTSFTGQIAMDGSTLLNWQTASEINNKGFYVQNSLDGISFENIGFVEGYGTINTTKNYTFHAITPSNWYYRLKQIDYDGAFEYSKTIYVSDELGRQLDIYPNPVSNYMKLRGHSGLVNKLTITNLTGQTLWTSTALTFEGLENEINEFLSDLKPSIYLIRIDNGRESLVKRIEKI
ncbi:MAG: T9SS type A sorting domain-containing protein [Reichenbachiella sp.]|uniref:T9SS type A sorting domain-containing protein n=1 Tax=Reichenbachiella sp. TaxID=2184521 RepID=UPI003296A2A0